MAENKAESGVQNLIDKLNQEGVEAGQQQSETLISDARQKADEIEAAARQQASQIVENARKEAQSLKSAGEDALQLACRDAIRDLQARVHEGFRERLRQLVNAELQEPELLKRILVQIAGQAVPGGQSDTLQVVLPSAIVPEQDIIQKLEAGEQEHLTEFVKGLIGQEIREGVNIALDTQGLNGFQVRVVEQDVEIDLTEEAVSDLLGRHLLPRFRAIMRVGKD